ncbi:hypothetical protein EYF80_000659 [Liparis tanakae]|uniref:Uncharacterized protein n=1 Tax=Liparis tanakae TaxID=230148 RepID=A0A4Z2JHI9_9TELE|nr:hypothetical protein EYF80_000659 [Liparis tanakae]
MVAMFPEQSRSLVRRTRRSSSTNLRERSRATCCSARFSARFRFSHLRMERMERAGSQFRNDLEINI